MVGEHQVWLLELSPVACINIMGPLLTVGECRSVSTDIEL